MKVLDIFRIDNMNRNISLIILFIFTHPLFIFSQTKSFETNSFNTLSISTSSTKKLESIIGEISGSNFIGSTKKIRSGFSNTSHSPGVVSDLITSTGSVGEGQVALSWTHTGRDGNIGQASSFEIKVATVPITYSNYNSINSALNVTALSPGNISSRTISNLPPGQLYYMAIRTKDSANMYSKISPNSTFYTYAIAPDPVNSISINTSSAALITLSWTVTGDDGNTGNLNPGYFRIDYSTDPSHSFSNSIYMIQISTIANAGSQQFYNLSNLIGNATYYATVYIGDDVTLYSGLSQIAQIVTQAYPPTLISFSNINHSSFTISFNADNSPGTEYYVQISSYSNFNVYLSSGWLTSNTITFSDLEPNTTYYVRAKAKNFQGIETVYSNFGSVYLPKISDTYSPQIPQVNSNISGGIFTLFWSEVKQDIRSNLIQIKRYEVFRSTSITGLIEKIADVSSNTLTYSQAISGNYWYFVRAVDINNNYSDNSMWHSNFQEYVRTVADDNNAVVNIPSDLNNELNTQKMILVLENEPEMEIGSVIASYRLSLKKNNNDVIYQDLSNNVTLIMPINKSAVKLNYKTQISYSQYDYAVYYDNGVEEVKLGGIVNPADGTVLVETKKTGIFKVRQVIRAQSFEITQTVPKKIFTPNGDGIFDEFNIIFENPEGLAIKDAKVYDLSGREIADLSKGTYNYKDSLMWNGKDKDGKIMPAGIYIYQFKAGDKYYNGTMVLAR